MSILTLAGVAGAAFAQQASSLAWSGYLPGDKADMAQAVALDRDGGVWLAGSSSSEFDAPGPNTPFQAQKAGGADVFLAKYKPGADGHAELVFWTWFGGDGDDDVRKMVLDSSGRIYLTGTTKSKFLPAAGDTYQSALAGETDVYVAVFDPSIPGEGSLVFSTLYGGAGIDVPSGLAVEAGGGIVVGGYTNSGELPGVSGGAQTTNRGGWEGFVLRFVPGTPNGLRYATYFGGSSTDSIAGVAVDRSGVIWFSGYTSSSDFPLTPNAYSETMRSSMDGFLAALDLRKPGLEAHVYGSYFGGRGLDAPVDLVIDGAGAFWIAGYTLSDDFPVTANAAQRTHGGLVDAFVMRLDLSRPPAEVITYSTFYGGDGGEVVYGFSLGAAGRAALSGYTTSKNLPLAGKPAQSEPKSGHTEAFGALINTAAAGENALEYSTYFGGVYGDVATGVAVDANGNLYLSGYTYSGDIPVTDESQRRNPATSPSAFALKATK